MSTFIQIAGSSAPNNSCITDTSLIGAAGTLNNYFAANLFKIDCTLSPGDALITYII